MWDDLTKPVETQWVPSIQVPSFVYLAFHLRRVVGVMRSLWASSEVFTHSEVVTHFSAVITIKNLKIKLDIFYNSKGVVKNNFLVDRPKPQT